MQWYEAEVAQLELRLRKERRPPHPVVFYGSSTIRLWDTVSLDLGASQIINLGFGGSTLEACVYFFERLVLPLTPCSLVVYAGDNDLGDGRSPLDVLRSFVALADKMERNLPEAGFGFISIKPSPARAGILDRIRLANSLVRDEIDRRERGYYLDLFPGMLNAAGAPRPELFEEDGLHMSRAGYLLWTDLISPYRQRIFTQNCPAVSGKFVP